MTTADKFLLLPCAEELPPASVRLTNTSTTVSLPHGHLHRVVILDNG